MKSTGVIRRIDELGRFVLPKELRNAMGIKEKDPLEIFTEGNRIILQKYDPTCSFCGNEEDLVPFAEKLICQKCLEELKKL